MALRVSYWIDSQKYIGYQNVINSLKLDVIS